MQIEVLTVAAAAADAPPPCAPPPFFFLSINRGALLMPKLSPEILRPRSRLHTHTDIYTYTPTASELVAKAQMPVLSDVVNPHRSDSFQQEPVHKKQVAY